MDWLRSMVRPTVTWSLVAFFGYGLIKGLIPWEAADKVITIVITFWFVERALEKAIEKAKE